MIDVIVFLAIYLVPDAVLLKEGLESCTKPIHVIGIAQQARRKVLDELDRLFDFVRPLIGVPDQTPYELKINVFGCVIEGQTSTSSS